MNPKNFNIPIDAFKQQTRPGMFKDFDATAWKSYFGRAYQSKP